MQRYSDDELIEALERNGGNRAATARELCFDERTLRRRLKRMETGAYTETPRETPQMLKGVSSLRRFVNEQGELILQWEKTSIDAQRMAEQMRMYAESFVATLDRLPAIPPPDVADFDTDIIPWFQIGDAHIGMLAHFDEVGHNFDLKIAERELVTAMLALIDRAPSCERCVIQDLGDFTHYQDFTAKSESGHDFDYDSRYPKMIDVAARVMRRIVDAALAKFQFVDVIVNQGNHSRSNDVWMRPFLTHVYENNKRLHVLNNSSLFIPYRMGKTFVMCHHSDKCKPNQLAHVMATDFAQDWGESVYRYIDIGHIHHSMRSKEHPGVMVESWSQLAPADKWAHDGGYRSRAFISVVMRSKTYGEKGRLTITAEEVKDIIDKVAPGTTAGARREVWTV